MEKGTEKRGVETEMEGRNKRACVNEGQGKQRPGSWINVKDIWKNKKKRERQNRQGQRKKERKKERKVNCVFNVCTFFVFYVSQT